MPIALFEKPLSALTSDDIHALLDNVEESQVLDFKERPRKGPKESDSWLDWETDAQRKELAKDVVAFANADGGWLVLGVRARKESPAIAEEITPIPNPEALAEKLLSALNARIDPYPHGIGARGIRTEADAGVVVVRVESSSDSPHAVLRGENSIAAHVRVGTESRPMSIRDIRNATLESSRRIDVVEAYLSNRSEQFAKFDISDLSKPLAGYRISIVPARVGYQVERLYGRRDVLTRPARWRFKNVNDVFYDVIAPAAQETNFRPMLRGTVAESIGSDYAKRVEALDTGAVETWYMRAPSEHYSIYAGWIVGEFLSACRLAHNIRTAARHPDAHLWCAVELGARRHKTSNIAVGAMKSANGNDWFPEHAEIRVPLVLPIYVIGSLSDAPTVALRIVNDLYNAGGLQDLAAGLTLVEDNVR